MKGQRKSDKRALAIKLALATSIFDLLRSIVELLTKLLDRLLE